MCSRINFKVRELCFRSTSHTCGVYLLICIREMCWTVIRGESGLWEQRSRLASGTAKETRDSPSGLTVKSLPASARDARDSASIPGRGRCPGGGHSNPVQCSCLENPPTEESDGLQSIGSQRVRHAWRDIVQQRKPATVWKISPSDWTDTKAALPVSKEKTKAWRCCMKPLTEEAALTQSRMGPDAGS